MSPHSLRYSSLKYDDQNVTPILLILKLFFFFAYLLTQSDAITVMFSESEFHSKTIS